MNKRFLFLSTAWIVGGFVLSAGATDIETNTARLQAMDKITGRVSEVDVPVNGLANFGTFSILVRKCVTTPPEETPENTAFVDVVDNYKSDHPVNIFKGWMFSSTPALNAVEHPIYDIWLLKCLNKPQNKDTLLSPEKLALRDSLPMVRPQKTKVSTSMKPVEEIDAAAEISETPAQPVEDEVIQVAISDKTDAAADSEESADSEIEFASEGEENLVEESEPSPEVDVSDSVEDEQPLEIVITNQEN